MQAWAASGHSLEETEAEMVRLHDLAEAVQNIAEPKVTFRLVQVGLPASPASPAPLVPCLHATFPSFRSFWNGQQNGDFCSAGPSIVTRHLSKNRQTSSIAALQPS